MIRTLRRALPLAQSLESTLATTISRVFPECSYLPAASSSQAPSLVVLRGWMATDASKVKSHTHTYAADSYMLLGSRRHVLGPLVPELSVIYTYIYPFTPAGRFVYVGPSISVS